VPGTVFPLVTVLAQRRNIAGRTVFLMPRRPRPQISGGLYHVTMRGNNRRVVFTSDADRRLFLTSLGTARERCGWRVHAYCLMTNHFHLLVETPEPNIAIGMQWLNSRYAHCFNQAYGRIGHLFQRRYADGLIRDEEHLRTVLRYIALNPVKAGLCKRPEDYPWSSYRATLGLAACPSFLTVDWLLNRFADDQREGRFGYQEWVEEGLGTTQRERAAPSLGQIFGAARPVSGQAIRRARAAGYTLQQIADHLGVSVATAWRWCATNA
jgi:REP element-mobilizing transposase RayT